MAFSGRKVSQMTALAGANALASDYVEIIRTSNVTNYKMLLSELAIYVRGLATVLVAGAITATSLAASGAVTAASLSATTVTGTQQTAAQPNITSLGTLTSLAVTGAANFSGLPTAQKAAGTDPLFSWLEIGTDQWVAGIDVSDGHKFKLNHGSALGTSDQFQLTTAGALTLASSLTATAVAVGTNPAASGFLRMPNNAALSARNFANTGDLELIFANASNQVCFDTSANGSVFGGSIVAAGIITAPLAGLKFDSLGRGSIVLDGSFNWTFNTNAVAGALAITSASGRVTTGFDLRATGAFGCNAANPQTAFASGGAAPAGGTGATAGAYDTAAHRDALITLVNNIRTALVNNGIMS
jgi:hypothetical protein